MMPKLPRGLRVAVAAPAGFAAPETVDAGIAALRRAGAEPERMPHLFDRGALAHLSAPDEARAADINTAAGAGFPVIWCARGGCGALRILDLIDWETLRAHRTVIAGFSDITALHWAMLKHGTENFLAAPMMKFLAEADDPLTADSLAAALDGKPVELRLDALRPGKISGPPLPGNIAVASALCGTAHFPDTAGRILVLEEVGEAPYRIDRMLTQLRLAGAFDRCAGIVFGKFTDCGEVSEAEAVLRDFSARVACPVFTGFPYGHELPFFSLSGRQTLSVTPR